MGRKEPRYDQHKPRGRKARDAGGAASRTEELFPGENQRVWVPVTSETTVKSVKHCFTVRQPMAFLTFGDISVSITVTESTLQF